jgi:hypothetical protein
MSQLGVRHGVHRCASSRLRRQNKRGNCSLAKQTRLHTLKLAPYIPENAPKTVPTSSFGAERNGGKIWRSRDPRYALGPPMFPRRVASLNLHWTKSFAPFRALFESLAFVDSRAGMDLKKPDHPCCQHCAVAHLCMMQLLKSCPRFASTVAESRHRLLELIELVLPGAQQQHHLRCVF